MPTCFASTVSVSPSRSIAAFRAVVEAAALVKRAVALRRPVDQVDAGVFGGLGIGGGDDLPF
jgi:hypothetical protein